MSQGQGEKAPARVLPRSQASGGQGAPGTPGTCLGPPIGAPPCPPPERPILSVLVTQQSPSPRPMKADHDVVVIIQHPK